MKAGPLLAQVFAYCLMGVLVCVFSVWIVGDGFVREDLKSFGQWESKTPGHPENFATPSPLYRKVTFNACGDMGVKEDGCGGCSNYLVSVVETGSEGESQFEDRLLRDGLRRSLWVCVLLSCLVICCLSSPEKVVEGWLEAKFVGLRPAELLGDLLSKFTREALTGFAINVQAEDVSHDHYKDGGVFS
ncbi:DNA mismatch repair protein MSH3 [Artemisia annua]|uniref:DNA mismatch repair protein MSH3 n=1 Tax=Artemisia annua TaxID=35608 RepID=A0A2U1L5F5_ARTAN|nr:DNA mismatch repair protein MSH3 [Artemisia annua]